MKPVPVKSGRVAAAAAVVDTVVEEAAEAVAVVVMEEAEAAAVEAVAAEDEAVTDSLSSEWREFAKPSPCGGGFLLRVGQRWEFRAMIPPPKTIRQKPMIPKGII